jgi:hypothetical protein
MIFFAVKIVLRHADADSRQCLHNEFNIYLTLDKAYQSGQLRDQIAPRCYGAFKAAGVDALILGWRAKHLGQIKCFG